MVTLEEMLLAPDVQPKVLDDCDSLIGQELSEKGGISGNAIKLAYKTVNTFKPDHIRYLMGEMLPQMVGQLEPFWADFQAAGGPEFGDYLAKRGGEVSEALLQVTDARAEGSGRPVMIKAYGSVRGSAAKHVEAALPRLGGMVGKYAS